MSSAKSASTRLRTLVLENPDAPSARASRADGSDGRATTPWSLRKTARWAGGGSDAGALGLTHFDELSDQPFGGGAGHVETFRHGQFLFHTLLLRNQSKVRPKRFFRA